MTVIGITHGSPSNIKDPTNATKQLLFRCQPRRIPATMTQPFLYQHHVISVVFKKKN